MISATKKNLLGVLVDVVDHRRAAELVIEAAQQRRSFSVSALAVHGVMTGVLNAVHRYRLNHLDLVVADGQPVRWALNHLYSAGLRQRVYGPNLMLNVVERSTREGIPVYFYGTTPGVLDALCGKLRQKFPGVKIAGAEPSQFATVSADAADEIAERIRASGAQIVFAGLGCPRQEVWAYEFRDRLNMPILAVGAAFHMLAGTMPMAPKWMQDRGLEWLFRLCLEPRRLWHRYLVLGPIYLAMVLGQWTGMSFHDEGKQPEQEVLYG
ncbi:MAG TPA: WecB/TagA/CpsF family glycosyltransferase [Terriglobales bacterium]|nr:WecB/TagA/CpsF family glycosyltransferase [Terriglobales bacterium]